MPVLPMRYSMDKSLVNPLPTFKTYSVGDAQRMLQRESVRQSETGEQRFVYQHIINTEEQDPDPSYHLGRMRLVRTSYTPFNNSAIERGSMIQGLSSVKEDTSSRNGSNHPLV
ncbi:hypothetical protein WJX73_010538 [Symbiochloris irregularis]|uniref:Phycobilisome linker polypeptide n=1 Tax=Symbiochloris irregularis TaxID=706552 RepID=A0AAW1NV43_9CHLO